tara:strand:+ start:8157 stop:9101 length:945 start_codon:yes stop_codon:yes gene_type:complete
MGSTRLKSRRRQDQGYKWARIAIAILSTIGLIDTGSITLNKWGLIGALSCPGGAEGCDKVLNSAWGTLIQGNNLSIPLSLAGLIGYSLILLISIIPFIPGLKENTNNLSRMSWWILFFVSISMTTFSLLLLTIMIFKIKAFCLFCTISAIISITILILTLIGGNWDQPSDLLFKGIIISLVVLLGGLIWSSSVDPKNSNISKQIDPNAPPLVQRESNLDAIRLASYLNSQGAIMYFAYWCKYCALQKELFGREAVSKLALVECAEDGKNNQSLLCKKKGITSYPSWEINGEITSGALSLDELADMVDYKGPRNF